MVLSQAFLLQQAAGGFAQEAWQQAWEKKVGLCQLI
jgi:hypothetical protein